MNILITLVAVFVGVLVIYRVLKVGKNQQMNEVHALMWLAGSVGIIVLGIFPGILAWFANLFGIFWAPSILVFFMLVVAYFILFNHSKMVSILINQVNELAINLSLLKHENEKLQQVINKTNGEKAYEDNDMQ